MNGKQIKRAVKYYTQYFPFTINTIICALACYLGYKMLYTPITNDDPTPFRPFIMIMGKVVFWFAILVIGISILSTLITWIHYLYVRGKNQSRLKVNFETIQKKGKTNKLFLEATLEGARRPILGFIKGRLFYDNHEMTDRFSLLSNQKEKDSFWRKAVQGRSRVKLPDIKEYEIKGGFVYFQDMLHIFSIAVQQPITGQFYQPPVLAKDQDNDVAPKYTEDLDVRIDQLRRVEGDYNNYKDFEAGDDIRRIVWKMYARNRELVVRVPERFEPYASHLYFYASFYANVKTAWLSDSYLKEMLNYYKNYVWTVYDTLSKKEWSMRYVPDQQFTVPEHIDEDEKSARIISNSNWQKETGLLNYFNPQKGTVLCISSFTDINELQELLEQTDASTVIYFIKTSRVFKHFVPWNWLKRLIFLPPKDRLNKLRTRWTFSPMRIQIQKKEKEIEKILAKANVTATTL